MKDDKWGYIQSTRDVDRREENSIRDGVNATHQGMLTPAHLKIKWSQIPPIIHLSKLTEVWNLT